MRIQNIGENETPDNQTFEGSLKLPASRVLYGALHPEGNVSFEDGIITVKFKAESLKDLKAKIGSWFRLYCALKGVDEEVRK